MFGSGQGALGEEIATSWKHLLPLPDALSYDQGAGESHARWMVNVCSQGKKVTSVDGLRVVAG